MRNCRLKIIQLLIINYPIGEKVSVPDFQSYAYSHPSDFPYLTTLKIIFLFLCENKAKNLHPLEQRLIFHAISSRNSRETEYHSAYKFKTRNSLQTTNKIIARSLHDPIARFTHRAISSN